MPRADPAVVRVVTAYSNTVQAVRNRVEQFVRRAWGGLGSYRDADIDRFVALVVPVVTGGQRQVAALTDVYLATIAAAVLGGAPRPVGVPVAVTNDIRGVPADDVYHRPGITVWTALAAGVAIDGAIQQGLTRALTISATDLQLAATRTAQHLLSRDDRVKGFRRVTNGGCCGLCDEATDEMYGSDEVLPIHGSCSCGVSPVYSDEDPGDVPGGTPSGENEGDTPTVEEHGELGRVLVVAGQHFTSADDI